MREADERKLVFRLLDGGLSIRKTAKLTGVPVGTVSSMKRRAAPQGSPT